VRERIATWLREASWRRAVHQYIAVLAGRARIEGFTLAGADGALVQ
jgi:peptidyl-prolyl cis-trans isomerase C